MNSSTHWDNDFDDEEIKLYENFLNEQEVNSFNDIQIHSDPSLQKPHKIQSIKQITNFTNKTQTQTENLIQTKIINKTSTRSSSFIEIVTKNKTKNKRKTKEEEEVINQQNNQRLTREAISFKEDFYSIFLNNIKGKKIIPKEKVIEIHNSICEEAGVRKMQRDEYRVINNYFKHFAKYRRQIISSIIKNKERLSLLINLPSIIERANFVIENRKKQNNNVKNEKMKQ